MRILLTGATGYIGLHTVRELLADGHEVTVLARNPGKLGPFAQAPKLRIVTGDLEQPERVEQALAGQQTCLHAALIWGEPGDEFEFRDTATTAKLFEAAGQAGVKRCVYISSAAVHRPFKGEMSEDDGLSATDLYGATKAAGELVLRAACASFNMSGVVIRPGPVVGPPAFEGASFHSDQRIESMVAAALDGRPLEIPGTDGRQFSDVSAIARTLRLLAEAENPHACYVTVDREILTWERIARKVVECLGSSSEVRPLPSEAKRPLPHFRTARFEQLLGRPGDAGDALTAHILHLAHNVRPSIKET